MGQVGVRLAGEAAHLAWAWATAGWALCDQSPDLDLRVAASGWGWGWQGVCSKGPWGCLSPGRSFPASLGGSRSQTRHPEPL